MERGGWLRWSGLCDRLKRDERDPGRTSPGTRATSGRPTHHQSARLQREAAELRTHSPLHDRPSRNLWIRESKRADPGVEPGVDNCTIERMAQHTSVPDGHTLTNSLVTPTQEPRQSPAVVFSTTTPQLTPVAARALLRIVLDAGAREACRSRWDPQPMASADGTLRD